VRTIGQTENPEFSGAAFTDLFEMAYLKFMPVPVPVENSRHELLLIYLEYKARYTFWRRISCQNRKDIGGLSC